MLSTKITIVYDISPFSQRHGIFPTVFQESQFAQAELWNFLSPWCVFPIGYNFCITAQDLGPERVAHSSWNYTCSKTGVFAGDRECLLGLSLPWNFHPIKMRWGVTQYSRHVESGTELLHYEWGLGDRREPSLLSMPSQNIASATWSWGKWEIPVACPSCGNTVA